MNKRKTMKIVISCVCVIVIMLFILYLLRGSVKIFPQEDLIEENTVFYLQNDSQWSLNTLGQSSYTMKSSGCLVTCIASAMQMEYNLAGDETITWKLNPGELNQYFTENQVYDAQGNLQWEQLNDLEGFQIEVHDELSSEVIMNSLQQGKYPIVMVRMKGYGSFHFVLIVEARDGMFYCMNPLNEECALEPLSDYNNRVYAIRCVFPDK